MFADRRDAGRRLAAVLQVELAERVPDPAAPAHDVVVCGIPRGGIVVAAEVATALGVPVRAIVARKVGAPGHAELAIGAVGPDGVAVINEDLASRTGASARWLQRAVAQARADVGERIAALGGVVTGADVAGRIVVVVDDGVATGATAAAVARWLLQAGAAHRVLALPVGPPATLARLEQDYDQVIALERPPMLTAVGQWYRDFTQTSDDEVARLLGSSHGPPHDPSSPPSA